MHATMIVKPMKTELNPPPPCCAAAVRPCLRALPKGDASLRHAGQTARLEQEGIEGGAGGRRALRLDQLVRSVRIY